MLVLVDFNTLYTAYRILENFENPYLRQKSGTLSA